MELTLDAIIETEWMSCVELFKNNLYHLIQQMSTKVPVSEMRKQLEEELQSCRQDLEIYIKKINLQEPESIKILFEEKLQKKKELLGCWFYEGMVVFFN